MAQGATNHPGRRLDSWKEIAAYFGRDERTVRRWEKESALPVHRVPGGAKGRVFAYATELDLWLSTPQAQQSTTSELEPQVGGTPVGPIQTTEVQPEGKHWRLGTAGMLAITLVACTALAAEIWIYRKNHRFAASASAPNASWVDSKDLGSSSSSVNSSHISPDSVAVLPFGNAGGKAATDYLSDGITESLIANLARIPEVKVRSRDSVFRFKGKDVEVRRAGGDLGVSVVVTGRVVQQGNTIEVSAEMTNVRDNTEMWGHRYSGKTSDLVKLQEQLASDVAEKLRSTLTASDRQRIVQQGTDNPEAYELYLKGRYAWNKRTLPELHMAISYFDQAIAKDPGYALAYSGLAETYGILTDYGGEPNEAFPKSNTAARKALALDPTLARPHAVLGVNEMEYDWDFAGGEAEFKKAFEIDPDDATAHQWYSEQLAQRGFAQQAMAEANRAHQLDPLSPIISWAVGYAYFMAREYDQTVAICSKLAAENPTFAAAHSCLADAYWAKSMYPQVIAESKAYSQLTGNPWDTKWTDALEQGFHSGGWKGALTNGIEVRKAQRQAGYFPATSIAAYYAVLGDKDRAFQWLDIARQAREPSLRGLKTSSFWMDPLRNDPRFAELARKVGLSKPQ